MNAELNAILARQQKKIAQANSGQEDSRGVAPSTKPKPMQRKKPDISSTKPSPAPKAWKPKTGTLASKGSCPTLDESCDKSDRNDNTGRTPKPVRERPAVPPKHPRVPPVPNRRINYENVDESNEGNLKVEDRESFGDSGKSSTCSEELLADQRFVGNEFDEEAVMQSIVMPRLPKAQGTNNAEARVRSNPVEPDDGDDSDYEPVSPSDNVYLPQKTRLRKQLSGSDPQLSHSNPVPPLPVRSPRKASAGEVVFPSQVAPPLPPRVTRAKSTERHNSDSVAPKLPPRNVPGNVAGNVATAPPPLHARKVPPTNRSKGFKRTPHPISGMDTIIQPSAKPEPTVFPHEYLPMDKPSKTPPRRPSFGGDYIEDKEVASVPRQLPSNIPEDPFPGIQASGSRLDSYPDDYLLLLDEDPDSSGCEIFGDEPLYQIYHEGAWMRDVIEGSGADDDDHEHIYDDPDAMRDRMNMILRDSAISKETQTSVMNSVSKNCSSVRKLWCETPQVLSSGILKSATPQEMKLQESLFEIIASEASYLKSLKVLVKEFIQSPQLGRNSTENCIPRQRDQKELFSNVKAVRDVSVKVLKELESLWKMSCVLEPAGICAILSDYAVKEFDVYVKYCSNQRYQDKALNRLKENAEFGEALKALELHPSCKGLTMQSFLMLPMQRVTRLPLLMDAVCHRIPDQSPDSALSKQCLCDLQKLVKRCNEGARRMENIEMVSNIDSKLHFKNCKKIALVSETRCLEKEGSLALQKPTSSILEKFFRRELLYLFLFNDLLLITRKKSDREYAVEEHAARIDVHAEIMSPEEIARRLPGGVKGGATHVFVLVLLKTQKEFLFSCKHESECTRWVNVIVPQSDNEDEHIYGEWDCPQVQALHQYVSAEPDELSLDESDIINVFRKMPDGWYEGVRLRDGQKGWFPANHTLEIQSAHTRAKNLRQKYRLLQNAHQELLKQKTNVTM